MKAALPIRKSTTKKLIRGSTFPCPNGWSSSDGLAEIRRPKKIIKDEKTSPALSNASAIIANELPTIPVINFTIINRAFPIKLKRIVRRARVSFDMVFFIRKENKSSSKKEHQEKDLCKKRSV